MDITESDNNSHKLSVLYGINYDLILNNLAIRKINCLFFLSFLILPFICISQTWDSLANNPIGTVDDGVGFSFGNKGFVGTGRDAGFQYRNDFYKFENNTWQQIASINGLPRQYATSFSFENTGCIVTGYSSQGSSLNDLQCYTDSTDTWTNKAPLPASGRLQASSFTIGSIGYCGGGRNSQGDLNDWYAYDMKTNSWTSIADFPNSRNECVTFSINGQGYVGLGRDNQGDFYNDFYRYNPLNDSWSKIANFPGDIRTYAIANSLNGKGYVCTGLDELGQLSNEFWYYDPMQNHWNKLTDFPYENIKGTSGFTIDDCMYISTGIDENSVRQDFCYSYCDEDIRENSFILYPNPTSDKLVLTSLNNINIKSVEIYNLKGQLIKAYSSNSPIFNINLSSISIGFYLVKVKDEMHNETITKLSKI